MRIFVAINPGEQAAGRLERELTALRPRSPGSKWVSLEGVHITLAYLGETEDARTPLVIEAVRGAARRHAPITLRIRGGGSFGKAHRPRILWAGVTGEAAALEALSAAQRDVERELAPFGYRSEGRPWMPHLTLARARDPRGDSSLSQCVEALQGIDFGEARVPALTIYRSDLAASGARYSALGEAPLAAG